MPGDKPDALEILLMEKYGLPQTQAEAFAQEITTDNLRDVSVDPPRAGSHGKYLQEEALSGVADKTVKEMRDLHSFATAASNPEYRKMLPSVNQAYEDRLLESQQNTRNQAYQSSRNLEADKTDLAAGELERIANMLDWSAGIKPLGGQGAYTTKHTPPGDFSRMDRLEGEAAVIPVQQSAPRRPSLADEPAKADPYSARLQRALQFRNSLLGR